MSPFWMTLLTTYNSSPTPNCSGLCSTWAMTMAATLPIDSIWIWKTMRFFSLLPAWQYTCNLASQPRSTPWLGESSLVAEALTDSRCRLEERLLRSHPEWTRGTARGAQPEATAWQKAEASADGRHWHEERQQAGQETREGRNERRRCNERQRHRRTEGSGVMRGDKTNSADKKQGHQRSRGAWQEAAAQQEVDSWRHRQTEGEWGWRLERGKGNDGIKCSTKCLIFLYFIFGPSSSSSIPSLSALAIDAGRHCRRSCCCCRCCCHCHSCCCAVSLLLNLGAAQWGRSVLFSDEQKLLHKGWKKGFVMSTELDFMRL